MTTLKRHCIGEKVLRALSGQIARTMFAGLVLPLVFACGRIEPGEEATAGELDHDVFKTSVQPVLDNRNCSDAGCHFRDKTDPNSGGPGGSLRLFECTAAPCSAAELQANHDSAAGMANLVSPVDSRLLSKPLALSEGGVQHLGDNLFLSVTDTDYLTILAWIQSPL
ncbi:MAG: hypothetical protein ACE5F7_07460 [Nitrospiria bacterium]